MPPPWRSSLTPRVWRVCRFCPGSRPPKDGRAPRQPRPQSPWQPAPLPETCSARRGRLRCNYSLELLRGCCPPSPQDDSIDRHLSRALRLRLTERHLSYLGSAPLPPPEHLDVFVFRSLSHAEEVRFPEQCLALTSTSGTKVLTSYCRQPRSLWRSTHGTSRHKDYPATLATCQRSEGRGSQSTGKKTGSVRLASNTSATIRFSRNRVNNLMLVIRLLDVCAVPQQAMP